MNVILLLSTHTISFSSSRHYSYIAQISVKNKNVSFSITGSANGVLIKVPESSSSSAAIKKFFTAAQKRKRGHQGSINVPVRKTDYSGPVRFGLTAVRDKDNATVRQLLYDRFHNARARCAKQSLARVLSNRPEALVSSASPSPTLPSFTPLGKEGSIARSPATKQKKRGRVNPEDLTRKDYGKWLMGDCILRGLQSLQGEGAGRPSRTVSCARESCCCIASMGGLPSEELVKQVPFLRNDKPTRIAFVDKVVARATANLKLLRSMKAALTDDVVETDAVVETEKKKKEKPQPPTFFSSPPHCSSKFSASEHEAATESWRWPEIASARPNGKGFDLLVGEVHAYNLFLEGMRRNNPSFSCSLNWYKARRPDDVKTSRRRTCLCLYHLEFTYFAEAIIDLYIKSHTVTVNFGFASSGGSSGRSVQKCKDKNCWFIKKFKPGTKVTKRSLTERMIRHLFFCQRGKADKYFRSTCVLPSGDDAKCKKCGSFPHCTAVQSLIENEVFADELRQTVKYI